MAKGKKRQAALDAARQDRRARKKSGAPSKYASKRQERFGVTAANAAKEWHQP